MKYQCWMKIPGNTNLIHFDVQDLLIAMEVFSFYNATLWGWS